MFSEMASNMVRVTKHNLRLINKITILTYLKPMFHFYTPWKYEKTKGFWVFSRGTQMKLCIKMGQLVECVRADSKNIKMGITKGPYLDTWRVYFLIIF